MIYTDRRYLSILALTEERDYVTYDELIHVLEERPSCTIYVERDGTLCGLITAGRIMRSRDEKNHRVPFNKKFTFVHPEECIHTRQIFRDKNINSLPVVSEDGRLLGHYIRWDDLIGIDYAELLFRDPYVLQSLKKNVQNAVLVQPAIPGKRTRKTELYLWWKHRLENKGIHLQAIEHLEIKDYRDVAKTFLIVDEDEKKGIEILDQHLYCSKKAANKSFVSAAEYLLGMKQLSDISFLKELQSQGVFILAFDFKENNNQFLAVLMDRIRKHDKAYGVLDSRLPEELKESFADELYCEAYKTQELPLQIPSHTFWGIPYFRDVETDFVHVQNGERLTVNQPEKYDRCIYIYGHCVVTGIYIPDQYTIASLLQSEINQAGFSCKVINRGYWGSPNIDADRQRTAIQLQSASFKQGDIIVVDQRALPADICPVLNLTDALEKHDAPADWFVNLPRHCNHKANQVFAHAIYEELVPVLQQPPTERTPVELDRDYIDRFYLRHYFSDFDHTSRGTIGAIVMNCNPFTFGHRFLIEEALKTVDFLIIFVVEEDESLFSFQERFAMVCQGTSDLDRVMVVPSGPYILSKNTFPEYFQKIDDEDLKKNTEDDITLFAEKIAPKLGIKYRFVGEEREDKVTNEYNDTMKNILPQYGIQVVEIPRKTNGQSVISASRVRRCLSTNHLEELDEMVPASTKRILFFERS